MKTGWIYAWSVSTMLQEQSERKWTWWDESLKKRTLGIINNVGEGDGIIMRPLACVECLQDIPEIYILVCYCFFNDFNFKFNTILIFKLKKLFK